MAAVWSSTAAASASTSLKETWVACWRQRLERRPVLLVRGRGQGAEGAAVIAALGGDEIGSSGGDAGELDSSLDGLRAGVGEEVAGQARRGDRGDLAQQLGADVAVEALVAGGKGAQLLAQRRGVLRVGVTEDRHAVVAHGVEIPPAVRVEEIGALATDEGDLPFGVEWRLVLILELLDLRQVERDRRSFLCCSSSGYGSMQILARRHRLG